MLRVYDKENSNLNNLFQKSAMNQSERLTTWRDAFKKYPNKWTNLPMKTYSSNLKTDSKNATDTIDVNK